MNKIILSCLFGLIVFASQAQNIPATSNTIEFFSKTPLEDIAAKTSKAKSVLNPETKGLAFKVQINNFIFPNKLMQEHFNENYMQSDKFPYATFEGTITDNVDLKKTGINEVNVKGKMTLHGVTKEYNTKATIASKDGNLVCYSKFKVVLKDHNIEVPKLVVKNIAESIDVTVNSVYTLSK